ncbi:quercetin dioxygenase-like cupin family protein [Rhodococcus sp. 27YEA15]|uniref:cupin domain-containing protein n=1 Tax=Rhodococcus sp. 27YEA15 TaxID=3156259 RepID=UPI003C7D9420
MSLDAVRVVVTGHSVSGKSVVYEDKQVPPAGTPSAGSLFHLLWGSDELPEYPNDGSVSGDIAPFPPVGGLRFVQMIVLPDSESDYSASGPDNVHLAEGEAPGMHTTASVDCCVVIEGEVWLELSDGKQVHLKKGDGVVQSGTLHGWRNYTATPARVGVFLVGTEHRGLAPRV